MDLYDKLNIRKLINAEGTLTSLGGSVMNPDVLDAMTQASKYFVDLNDLLEKSGQYVAELLGVEAAYISCGAAAGLTLSTAACITGCDPAKIRRLPHLRGLKNEVLIQKSHRNGYDHAVRQAGVTIVEFGLIKETEPWEMRAAISERTAAVVYFVEFETNRNLPLADVIAIAAEAEIPVIVDAAAELPPVENLARFCHMGADLTVFSGGKHIGGPQASGLILGRRELIKACGLNANPHYSIGRPMKVGKEEIAGLVTALEQFLKKDFAAEERMWEDMVAATVEALADVPGLQARRVCPGEPGIQPNWIPRVHVDWNSNVIPLSRRDVKARLRAGQPAIAVGTSSSGLFVNPQTLIPGQEKLVAQRLREVFLSQKGGKQPMKAEEKIKSMGLALPTPPKPVANYVPAVRTGNLIFLSGHGPVKADGTLITGKVGTDLTLEQGYQAARQVALVLLASLKAEIDDLDRVKRVIKLLGMVNCPADFGDQPKVVNGASDLLVEVFGDKGRHARSAVGMNSLPNNIAVEIEMIVEVESG